MKTWHMAGPTGRRASVVLTLALIWGGAGSADALHFVDDFNDSYIHSYWWEPVRSLFSTVEEAGGRAVMTQGSSGDVRLEFRYPIEGDFVIEVDFGLLNWPASNNQLLAVAVYDAMSNFVASMSFRGTGGGSNEYYSAFGSMWISIATTDTNGLLRINREGDEITTNLITVPSQPTGPLVVRLEFFGVPPTAGAQIAFDNFLLHAPGLPEVTPCADNPGGADLGGFIPVWVGEDTIDNFYPTVTYNPVHDEYLVTWLNVRAVTDDYYARRITGGGTVLSWFALTNGVGALGYSPVRDDYLLVYTVQYAPNDIDLWAQQIAWDGSSMGTPFVINQDLGDQKVPRVAYNSLADEYLVVYVNTDTNLAKSLLGVRLASNGAILDDFTVATLSSDISYGIAYNPVSNQYLVVFTRPDGGGELDLYGKLLSSAGAAASGEVPISTNNASLGGFSLAGGLDEYLVVWAQEFTSQVYACRMEGSGVVTTPPDGVRVTTKWANGLVGHFAPEVAFAPDGHGYLIVWERVTAGPTTDVWAARWLTSADAPFGEPFPVDDTAFNQRAAVVAGGAGGQFCVVESDQFPGLDYEIRGRMVDPNRLEVAGINLFPAPALPVLWWEDWGCGWEYTVEIANDPQGLWGPAPGTWSTRETDYVDASAGDPSASNRVYRVKVKWAGAPY